MALAAAACGARDSEGSGPTATANARRTELARSVPTVQAGLKKETFQHDGLDRMYRVYVPAPVASAQARVPLVIGLHGGLGSADQFAETSRLDKLAESEGFISVFPEGIDRTWNAGRCCGQAVSRKIDDVGFLSSLIDNLIQRYPIDPDRVFVMGHSNGAMMAFRLACEKADIVRAIVPVAGSLEIPECKPSRGVNLLAIHGDADMNHPIEGGRGPRSIAGVSFNSMAHTMAVWTATMKCAGQPERKTDGPLSTSTWKPCRDDTLTRFTVIAGADHPWPGSERQATELQGEPSQAMDATRTAWEFFKEAGGR